MSVSSVAIHPWAALQRGWPPHNATEGPLCQSQRPSERHAAALAGTLGNRVNLAFSPETPTVPFAASDSLQHVFEAAAAQRSQQVALALNDEVMTYAEVNARANQLAHFLRSRGIGPEIPVAICLERSFELIIGVLGILKAGAAYLPIDPVYPTERKAFMLADSRTPLVLTQASFAEEFAQSGLPVVCLDRDQTQINCHGRENPPHQNAPENLAYIIYTSGSTGKPKGVMIEHRQVLRLFDQTYPWFNFTEQDVWTLFHSIAFDFSVWELWGALLFGGKLVIVPFWQSRSPEAFWKVLHRHRVTVLNQTPSAFRQLIAAEPANAAAPATALRYVIFGGEALELQSLRPWFQRHGESRPQLVNMYGITETTVHVTYRPLKQADLDEGSGSVIGVPIPDLGIYLLEGDDGARNDAPAEMFIAGAGLGRGYLNRPDLTAERFIPDAISLIPGSRLYRSGDLARHGAGGDLEYLGRADQQVKIRGFRIELGEIESVLCRHRAVQQAVVVTRADATGEKELVAYWVGDAHAAVGTGELRAFVQQKLPDYMVPAHFVPMTAFPLTTNGKIDRHALPAPSSERPQLATAFVGPASPLERAILGVWQEVLGIEHLGVHDNFFDVGGQSLKLVQVQARLKQILNRELQTVELFQYPTIRALAAHLSQSPGNHPTLADRVRSRAQQQRRILAGARQD